jgi:hypothetical protein
MPTAPAVIPPGVPPEVHGKLWPPRASKMGGYLSCDMRAAFDRAIYTGEMPYFGDHTSSPYADLGTCIHFELQDGLRCVWPTADAKNHKYTPEQFASAATLFGGNHERTLQAIRHTAAYSAVRLPKAPDGKPWRAEVKTKSRYFTGTIDFLSQCNTEVGDLKTTSKRPAGDKVKYAHLIQMVVYHINTGAARGWVFYVDSKSGSWSVNIPIDFTTPEMQELADQIRAYALYIKSKRLYNTAVPRMGDHCSDNFCPYRVQCRDRYQPPAGTSHDASVLTARTSANPFKK